MATPESLVKAMMGGLVEALLSQPDAKKEPKPKVVKTDDVDAAVAKYLPEVLAKMAGEEPVQQDLFDTSSVVDISDQMLARRKWQEAQDRAEMNEAANDEMPPGTYDANMPGAPWTSAVNNS